MTILFHNIGHFTSQKKYITIYLIYHMYKIKVANYKQRTNAIEQRQVKYIL